MEMVVALNVKSNQDLFAEAGRQTNQIAASSTNLKK